MTDDTTTKRKKTPRPMADRWLGGYIRRGKSGATYVIDRTLGGVHYHQSTRCKTKEAALKALARFEADPAGFSGVPEVGVTLTAELVLQYRDWMIGVKGNTREWSYGVANFLADWCEDLGTADLRRVTVPQLKAALDRRKTSRKHRVEAIKGFFAWLRKERGALRHSEDCTLDLPVPTTTAAKLRRRRAVEPERLRAVFARLDGLARDTMLLLSATGWHVAEVRRFAGAGELVETPGRADGVLAVCITWHKTKRRSMAPLRHVEHLEAAKRLKAAKKMPSRWKLLYLVHKACDEAGVPFFGLGDMRHSYATHAAGEGASVEDIAAALDHRTRRTTEDLYIDLAVPRTNIPILKLVN